MTTTKKRRAVIYCRVESMLGAFKDEMLASQEACCRQYADDRDYELVYVFIDHLASDASERIALKAMLDFVVEQAPEPCVVIVDDIFRLDHDLGRYLAARAAIREVGAILESPSFRFEDDPGNILVENLLVSAAQYRRQIDDERAERMRNLKTRSRKR